MSSVGLFATHVRYVNRAFWRNPAAAFFTLAFPLIFLVLFSVLFGNQPAHAAGQQLQGATFTLAAILTFSVIGACYTNIAIGVTFARENGVLKRLRGTPLPGATYLAARIGHAMLIALLLVLISCAFDALAYGVNIPGHSLPALLATLLAGAVCFSALGLAITAVIPNADASPAVVNALLFPLLFVSNVFIPINHPAGWLNTLTSIFPVKPFGAALKHALVPGASSGFSGGDLLALAVWGLLGVIIAVRLFSWEPRQQPG